MTVVGHQDFWVAGSYLYFKRDDVGSTKQPLFDIGVVETASPSTDVEKFELVDSRSGQKQTVDETVTKLDESYDVVISNVNLDNFALLFLAESPEAFSQVAGQQAGITHWAHAGRLLKVLDDDVDSTPLFAIQIEGVIKDTAGAPTTHTVTDVAKAARSITISVAGSFADGEVIILTGLGLSNIANARSYTVNGVHTSQTVILVNEQPAADETSITGSLLEEAVAGDFFEQDVDWEPIDHDKGILRMMPGGAFTTDGNVKIYYTKNALTGNRVIKPQSQKGEIKGEIYIYWARSNDDEITVRRGKAVITPNAASLSVDEYSNITLTIRMLSDLSASDVAGEFLQIKGALPTTS